MNGFIHSFESLAALDGAGIRFAVFMAGCPLRCAYCHNPDTWDFSGGEEVTAEEIHFAIKECIEDICKVITEVLEVTPPELVNDITDDGIFLCGGVAAMYGLDKFIEKQTGIKVKIPGRETDIAALGCLRTMCEENYLSQNGYHFVTLETLG